MKELTHSEKKLSQEDQDLDQVIARFHKMNDELIRRLEEVYRQTGWDRRQIKTYLDNPNNFTEGEWEQLKGERESLEKFLGASSKEKNPLNLSFLASPEGKPKEGKERRKGARARKSWIPL